MRIEVDQNIIPSIAGSYTDTNRVFMEYIDNSIDSSQEFFDEYSNSYTKDINIHFQIDKKSVSIKDNCFGITNFTKVVKSVGKSDKKDQPFSNGQFGFGIYSFIAACEEIEIITKLKDDANAYKISINQKKVFIKNQEIDEPAPVDFDGESGTNIVLSKFEGLMWKKININEIVSEVEKHFELLLKRENLTITISDSIEGTTHICKAFDYDEYDGEEWDREENELSYSGIKNRSIPSTIYLEKPIHIYLKLLKGKVIGRPPVFIAKGRRIAEIREIKQFKTNYRQEIWGNPKLTGYIDVTDFLEPEITRTNFRNNANSNALFSTLVELEKEILLFLSDINKQAETSDYKSLEQILNQKLSKLAKIDALNFRTENIKGSDVNLQSGGVGEGQEQGAGSEHHRDGENTGNDSNDRDNNEDPEGYGPSELDGNNPSDQVDDGANASNKEADNPFEDTGLTGSQRKKSGFNIEIVSGDPDEIGDTGVRVRSALVGGTIRIWREHPDFRHRISYSIAREPKITQRLVTYLAGEITVHYKDKIQTREGQAEYNIEMFRNLVDFIYNFEDAISDLAGKKLSDLSE